MTIKYPMPFAHLHIDIKGFSLKAIEFLLRLMGTFSVLIVTPNVLQFLRLGSKHGLSIKISPIHPGLYAHAHSEYTDYALVLRSKKITMCWKCS